MGKGDKPKFLDEQRLRTRVHTRAPIQVSGHSGLVKADLMDLSRGGARLHTRANLGKVGQTVELFLPGLNESEEITVMAEIVRVHEQDEVREFSLRFVMAEPLQKAALSDLLDALLMSNGGGSRRHARVARRVALTYGSRKELSGLLEEISQGGLSLTGANDLSLHDVVMVDIPGEAGGSVLSLRARVVHRRELPAEEGASLARVGLEFDPLSPDESAQLSTLLAGLAREAAE